MFKSPVRNQRSKGVKVKQVLQICFLLGVCFWLVYQVKHSRNEKKPPDVTDANKNTVRTIPSGDILKLGRKDANPRFEQPALINGKSTEEDEEIAGEVEDNKIELLTEEEAGEDGVDELEKSDSEVGVEELNKAKDVEDNGKSLKNENMFKEKNVGDETKSSTHESRDENYKADDASSAVTQTSRFVGSETEVDISNKSTGKESLTDEKLVGNISSNNVVEGHEVAETTKTNPVDFVAETTKTNPVDFVAETTTVNVVKNEDAASNKETNDSGNVSLDFKNPVSTKAEGKTQFSDIKNGVKAETKPETDVKALATDNNAQNAENGGEVQRDSTDSYSAARWGRKDGGADMEMLANVLNEDNDEEEAAE